MTDLESRNWNRLPVDNLRRSRRNVGRSGNAEKNDRPVVVGEHDALTEDVNSIRDEFLKAH